MEISQLRAFVAVAESGGFAAAAESLQVVPSSVTRAVAKLEASLGVRVFQRTTRSVCLTEAGERFLQRISPALDEIDAAIDSVNSAQSLVSGLLRVSASISFGQSVLAPRLKHFIAQYPHVQIELALSDSVTDLVAERIDVAIRHGVLPDSALVARRLRDVQYRLVASPDYVERSKKITGPRDIIKHPCLSYPYPSLRSQWHFHRGVSSHCIEIEPVIRMSNASALACCVKSGAGVSLLADWLIDDDIANGRLVHLLPGWVSGGSTDTDPALWIVMPTRQFVPTKTKAFIAFLQESV